ncbi:MAG: T9SS type A sorting domain-containing protein [Saprospiraceae bacterium]|nr:T9SS type A sorting domain-containing protein [Saprospiraceae bacterium]
MKMLSTLCLTLAFVLCHSVAPAQTALSVNNPNWWGWGNSEQATIEEATIVVRPKGLYMEVGLYLELSADGTSLEAYDELEIKLDFGLPADAIIHDSWLWIDDQIIKADLLDRWTASGIYEEIVDRAQDPSILYQLSPTQYQLRIFPLNNASQGPRKVKITYLMPVDWSANTAQIELPVEIMRSSVLELSTVDLRVWTEAPWNNPRIYAPLSGQTTTLNWVDDNVWGGHQYAELTGDDLKPGLSLIVDAPFENGVFASHNETEQMYQFAVLPRQALNMEGPTNRKVVFVLNYDLYKTNNLTKEEMLQTLRQSMLDMLNPSDSFNLIYQSTLPANNTWLPADEQTINSVMAPVLDNPNLLTDYDDLFTRLNLAIDFVQIHNQGGEIIALSNSDSYADTWSANNYIDQLLADMGADNIPIHIVDYQNFNYVIGWSIWNQNIVGNTYFYDNLTRLTGGLYERGGSIFYKLRHILEYLDAFEGILETYTTFENGFTYQRYNLGGIVDEVPFGAPLRQVGKYQGQLPMQILLTGEYNGASFGETITIDTSQSYPVDTLIREIWAGNSVHSLQGQATGNANIAAVIDRSLEERVLSIYTAFLCLEPSLGGEPCLECIDETFDDEVIISTNEKEIDIEIKASPNPFVDLVNLTLSGLHPGDSYRIAIYNAQGQVVHIFAEAIPDDFGELTLEWDSSSHPAGLYFFAIEGLEGRAVAKLVKQP